MKDLDSCATRLFAFPVSPRVRIEKDEQLSIISHLRRLRFLTRPDTMKTPCQAAKAGCQVVGGEDDRWFGGQTAR